MNKLNNNEALQRTTVIPTMKKSLLALAVAGTMAMSGNAFATAAAGAIATATVIADGATITTTADGKYASMDTADGSENTIAITIDHNTTLYIEDAGANSDNDVLTIGTAATTIAADKTFTIMLGRAADNTTEESSGAGVTFSTAVTGVSGTMAIVGSAGVLVDTTSAIDFAGAITLNEFSITGGAGGAANAGPLSLTDIGAESTITTFTIAGGAGAATADSDGGAVTVAAIASKINGTTLNITGGDGAVSDGTAKGGDGGAVTVTTLAGEIASTTFNITSGTGAAGAVDASGIGGNGGAVSLADMDGAFTGTTLNITSGNGGDGLVNVSAAVGGNGGAMAELDFDGAVTSIVNITSGTGGIGGAGTATAGGNGGNGAAMGGTAVSFAATVTGAVTITSGSGGAAGASTLGQGGVGGAGGAIDNVSFAGLTGALIVNSGIGGAGSSATTTIAGENGGVGGAITIDSIATQIGNVTLTAGDGGASGASGTTGAAGAGAVGGTILVSDFTTSLTGDLSMTAGNGSDSAASGTGVIGVAGANGGDVTVSNIVAYAGSTAAGGDITLLAGNAGNVGASTTGFQAAVAGTGGDAVITDLEGTPDIATLSITAGNGGNGGNGGTTQAGRASAAAGVASLTTTGTAVGATIEVTTLTITAGNAGNGGAGGTTGVGGAGTAGGNATFTNDNTAWTAQAATGATTVTITGGNGGNGGNAGTGVAGVAGVAGGTAQVNFDGTATTIAANVTLDDGTAGTAGTTSGSFAGGAAGGAGQAVLDFNAATSQAFTGNILAAADGEGSITIDGSTLTINGTVGAAGVEVDDLTATTAAVTTNNSLYIEDITLVDGASDLTLNGTTAKVVSGAITGGAGTADIITGASSSWTFEGAVGKNSAGTISAINEVNLVAAGTTATFNSTVNADLITTSATGTVTFNDLVTTAILDVTNASTITLGSGFVAGETVFKTTAGATAFDTAATINMPQTFNTGAITLIDDTGTTAAADALLLDFNTNVLSTYTAAANTDDNTKLDVTAVRKTAALVASELNITTDQANALHHAVTSVGTEDATGLAAMNTILVAGVTSANVEQLQPDVTSANGASLASVNAVNNVIAGRQANTKIAFNTLGNQSGVSTGDAANDLTVWAQIFGSNANQDAVGTMDGYDADSKGLALGWEANKSGDLMGLSVSYSDADVDGKSASVSHTDSTAVQASVYGTYNKSTDWMIGYALANNDTSRTINLGGLSRTASGSYDSGIMSAKIGHTFATSGEFTPKVDASWTRVDNDGYTETGADNLGLIVADSDHDVVTLRAGGEMAHKVSNGTARFSVMGGYDVVNDNVVSTATFIGGGSSFTTTGADADKVSLQLGLGYDSVVSDDSTVSLDLNADLRADYDSMSGSLTYKSKF